MTIDAVKEKFESVPERVRDNWANLFWTLYSHNLI